MNNYIFKINIQAENDVEIYQKAIEVAIASGEIVYISHGIRDLGFVTKKGDVGTPDSRSKQSTETKYDTTPIR